MAKRKLVSEMTNVFIYSFASKIQALFVTL